MVYFRSWYGWLSGELAGREMIVPEVSRVTREPVDGAALNQSDFLLQMFNHPRSFSESVISFICFDILSIFIGYRESVISFICFDILSIFIGYRHQTAGTCKMRVC